MILQINFLNEKCYYFAERITIFEVDESLVIVR